MKDEIIAMLSLKTDRVNYINPNYFMSFKSWNDQIYVAKGHLHAV